MNEIEKLNEEYSIGNIRTVYAGFFQDTLGNLEKEAMVALLVEFWKRKGEIKEIDINELWKMIIEDVKKYKNFFQNKRLPDKKIKERIKDGTLPFNPLFRPMVSFQFDDMTNFLHETIGKMTTDKLLIFTSSTSFIPTDKLLQPIFKKYSP